jgi:hypothetical protein
MPAAARAKATAPVVTTTDSEEFVGGATSLADGLENLVTGLGTDADKSMHD